MTCNASWFRGAPAPGALISNLRQHREVPMRKKHFARSLLGSLAITAGLLFPLATTSAQAQSVQYSATFDGSGMGDPGTGSFLFNETTGLMTDFIWDFGSGRTGGITNAVLASRGFGDSTVGESLFEIFVGEFKVPSPGRAFGFVGNSIVIGPFPTAQVTFCWGVSNDSNCGMPEGEFPTYQFVNNGVFFRGEIAIAQVDTDGDEDGVSDDVDNCLEVANPDQLDTDGDDAGNACDTDDDNDTVADAGDNCPFDPNSDQADADRDGAGVLCDADLDGDGVPDSADQCVPTPSGQVVNGEGCAIAQICPCDNNWRNRVAYVACVARTGNDFREDGLISARELVRIVLQAGRSRCGARSGN
jgi:Thrombospondin type 3 repeat